MKRLFIASKIEIDSGLSDAFAFFKRSLSTERIRWVDFYNIHITYEFLGNTDENNIHKIASFVSQIADNTNSFDVTIKSAGLFKNIQNPTVIWFGIEPNPTMNEVKMNLDKKLEAINFETENRTFKPHLTIGRMKAIDNTDNLKYLINTFQNKIISRQKISEIILYESKLSASGPVYRPLFKSEFKHDDL